MSVAGCEMVRAPVPRGAGSRHSASTSEMVVSIFSSRPFSPRQHHPSSAWPEPRTMACLGGPRCCAFVCDVGSRQLCPRWFRGSGRVHHLAPNTTPQIPAVMTASDGINRSYLCSSAPYGSKVIFRETIRGFNGLWQIDRGASSRQKNANWPRPSFQRNPTTALLLSPLRESSTMSIFR